LAGLSPASATLISFNVSGSWGQADSNNPAAAFQGTITYNTATLSYLNGSVGSGYGNPDGGNDAGSYTISWNGHTYSAAVSYIQWYQEASCDGGVSPSGCARMIFMLKSAITGANDGELRMLLHNDAPFDTGLAPDIAPSSDAAYFAMFTMSESNTPGRYTTTGQSSAYAVPGAGASLSFGPATSDVPEPASWSMMIGGFGMIGGALRRQRKSITATA